MSASIWLIPALPFAGFLLLALAGKRLPRAAVSLAGVGSVGAAAAVALASFVRLLLHPPPAGAFVAPLWQWLSAGGFHSALALRLDALAAVMAAVVSTVAFLICLYSAEHMAKEAGYSRFFAVMDLFVGAMLTLVLADDLLLLYIGWEGVGLCSYLLIAFWYREPSNVSAANKAFIITRIGDTALLIGLILLYVRLGTWHIPELLAAATRQWRPGEPIAIWVALCLLAGAAGKSAQLPLQTWLPDAMAGPAPVSALIHAATMVAAGVYLIARTHPLFALAPAVQQGVAIIGGLTLLVAAASALTQRDIKRALAYSTMSQIGYMFLALGVGAWSAAIFHFMTHAFFKACLFLGAGTVIAACGGEHDLHRMGGLRRQMPVTFWTFLAGAAALSALPLVTAGFYSKDWILLAAWASGQGGFWLWSAGIAGAFLTALYAFRIVFLVFFGPPALPAAPRPGIAVVIPLVALAVLSLVSGFVQMPAWIAPVRCFSDLLSPVLAAAPLNPLSAATEIALFAAAALAPLAGLAAAWWFYGRSRQAAIRTEATRTGFLWRFWLAGWGFDALYGTLFVRPFIRAARLNRDDGLDRVFTGAARLVDRFAASLAGTQSGRVSQYARGIALGAALALGLVLAL